MILRNILSRRKGGRSFVTWRSAINNQKLCKTKALRIDFPVEKIKRTNFTHVSLLIIMFFVGADCMRARYLRFKR